MTRTTHRPDINDLALLDPARGHDPSPEQWTRAQAHLAQVIATGRDEPRAVVRPPDRRRMVLGATGLVTAAAAMTLVVGGLPGSGTPAYASWTPAPQRVTALQALEQARACAQTWPRQTAGSGPTAADVVLAERRGEGALTIVRNGSLVMECMAVTPKVTPSWMQLFNDADHLPAPAARTVTVDGIGSNGTGAREFSHLDGRVGAGVTGVDVMLRGGPTIRATVRDGWWATWWPGGQGGEVNFTIVVHDTAGSTTHKPEDLFAN